MTDEERAHPGYLYQSIGALAVVIALFFVLWAFLPLPLAVSIDAGVTTLIAVFFVIIGRT